MPRKKGTVGSYKGAKLLAKRPGESMAQLYKRQQKEFNKIEIEKENFQKRCLNFYRDKTLQRIKQYKQQQTETEINTINGIHMCSIAQLIENINFDNIENILIFENCFKIFQKIFKNHERKFDFGNFV